MSADSKLIPVSQMASRLRQMYGRPCTYNLLWRLVSDGVVPAERLKTRLFFYEHQIPEIARALGMIGGAAPIARRATAAASRGR